MSELQAAPETMLLTIVLKHDQSKNLADIQAQMKQVDWWERFPIEGSRVVSWTVAMGLGQIVDAGTAAVIAAAGQRRTRTFCLGRVSHRMLSHLRFCTCA